MNQDFLLNRYGELLADIEHIPKIINRYLNAGNDLANVLILLDDLCKNPGKIRGHLNKIGEQA